jgi:hypothetical protein
VQENFTQLVTRNEAIPYPMWYNVIPPYLFLDLNLYPGYFNEMKMFELVNPRTTTISMAWYPYPRPNQPIMTTSNTPYSTSVHVSISIQPILY